MMFGDTSRAPVCGLLSHAQKELHESRYDPLQRGLNVKRVFGVKGGIFRWHSMYCRNLSRYCVGTFCRFLGNESSVNSQEFWF